MNKKPSPKQNSLVARWRLKFANALRGLAIGTRGQSSFSIHFSATLAVVGLASWLQVSPAEWLTLIVCITVVFATELLNSAIEHLARAITREQNAEIRNALDIASGAVLLASLGAAIVGLWVLGWPLLRLLFSV